LNYHHCGLILLWIGALLSWYTVCLVYWQSSLSYRPSNSCL
jgi:hypothetical protein